MERFVVWRRRLGECGVRGSNWTSVGSWGARCCGRPAAAAAAAGVLMVGRERDLWSTGRSMGSGLVWAVSIPLGREILRETGKGGGVCRDGVYRNLSCEACGSCAGCGWWVAGGGCGGHCGEPCTDKNAGNRGALTAPVRHAQSQPLLSCSASIFCESLACGLWNSDPEIYAYFVKVHPPNPLPTAFPAMLSRLRLRPAAASAFAKLPVTKNAAYAIERPRLAKAPPC